jgi:hypothetical protein
MLNLRHLSLGIYQLKKFIGFGPQSKIFSRFTGQPCDFQGLSSGKRTT